MATIFAFVVVKNIIILNVPSLNVYKIQIAMYIMRTAQKTDQEHSISFMHVVSKAVPIYCIHVTVMKQFTTSLH